MCPGGSSFPTQGQEKQGKDDLRIDRNPLSRSGADTSLFRGLDIDFLHSGEYIKSTGFSLVVQSCPTLCDPMGRSPPGSSVHGGSLGKNSGVGCHALLQGIFPTQGSNPGLSHYKRILYHLVGCVFVGSF